MKYSLVLVAAAGFGQVSATFGFGGKKFFGAKPFECPKNIDNICLPKHTGGIGYGGLDIGTNYGKDYEHDGFKYGGGSWTCGGKKGNRHRRTGGDKFFETDCGAGVPSPYIEIGKNDAPKSFSMTKFKVEVEEEGDMEMEFELASGRKCRTPPKFCQKGMHDLDNNQCGGAKKVTFHYKPKKGGKCKVKWHHIDLDCNNYCKPGMPGCGTPPEQPCTPGKPGCPPETPCTPGKPGCPPETPCTPGTPGCPPETPCTPGKDGCPEPQEPCTPGQDGCPEETPSVPQQPEETPSVPPVTPPAPEQPQETPSVPEQPEETPSVPEETPSVPEQPEETPSVPEETPSVPEETPSVPEQPEETPSVPEETPSVPEETPSVPEQPEEPEEPEGPDCPEVVPSCLNTWIPVLGECKNSLDKSCYCKHADLINEVYECIYANGETDDVIAEAIQALQGICAPEIPENPAIITGGESITSCITVTGTPIITSAVYTTIVVDTTLTVPCVESGITVPGSSTVTVIKTEVPVPEVTMPAPPKETGSQQKPEVPGEKPEVPSGEKPEVPSTPEQPEQPQQPEQPEQPQQPEQPGEQVPPPVVTPPPAQPTPTGDNDFPVTAGAANVRTGFGLGLAVMVVMAAL